MNLTYDKNNLKECIAHINRNNPSLTQPVTEKELEEAIYNGLFDFKASTYSGILFQYLPMNDDFYVLMWILPHYVSSHKELDLVELQIEESYEDIINKSLDQLDNIVEQMKDKDTTDVYTHEAPEKLH